VRSAISLCAAALIAAALPLLAQGVPNKTPGLQYKVSKKHPPDVSGYAPLMQGSKKRYPEAFGYAPSQILDRETEMSRQAGGGGGGGGGGGK
jgi:hypothetical protein